MFTEKQNGPLLLGQPSFDDVRDDNGVPRAVRSRDGDS